MNAQKHQKEPILLSYNFKLRFKANVSSQNVLTDGHVQAVHLLSVLHVGCTLTHGFSSINVQSACWGSTSITSNERLARSVCCLLDVESRY